MFNQFFVLNLWVFKILWLLRFIIFIEVGEFQFSFFVCSSWVFFVLFFFLNYQQQYIMFFSKDKQFCSVKRFFFLDNQWFYVKKKKIKKKEKVLIFVIRLYSNIKIYLMRVVFSVWFILLVYCCVELILIVVSFQFLKMRF